MALPAPALHIPPSDSTVSVSIIDTTTTLRGVQAARFIEPAIKGHEYIGAPAFSFLVRHPRLGRSLIFDLGVRKDWWNGSPAIQEHLRRAGYEMDVKKGVREILEEGGVDAKGIEAVIWSHYHFDHTGDPSTFEPSTKLIVGPGFKEHMLPGYPANPNSVILESDYAGRELVEISFEDTGLQIGRFRGFDYFGDGSFYLLDSPGHAIGHLCGLARVKSGGRGSDSDSDSFIFMGGDACHQMGQIRPSPYLPLPEAISPHPFLPSSPGAVCPGALFEPLLPASAAGEGHDRTHAFYEPARGTPDVPSVHTDPAEALRTVHKIQEADVRESVFVVVAHDEHMLDVVDFFPATADDFVAKGWLRRSRWAFLKDFYKAVGWKGEVEGKRDWAPRKKDAGKV